MLDVQIAGLGSALPRRVVTGPELEARFNLPPGYAERVAGVRNRRHADPSESCVGLAADAARMALRHAGLEADQFDAVVGASSGPHQLIPCTAALVHRELGLPEGRSVCFDVNATCISFLAALHAVAHMVAAGAYRRVLIFSSDLVSRTLNPAEPEAALLFGDAAAAAVIVPTPRGSSSRIVHAKFATHSAGAELSCVRGGGSAHPPNDPATTAAMNLFEMRGPALLKMATRLMPPFLDDFFAPLGPRSEVDAVVPHQASRLGLRLLTARCGFRDEQVVDHLAERGNCVAASLPLALAEAVHAGRIERGQRVALIGTGAGLTLAAMEVLF